MDPNSLTGNPDIDRELIEERQRRYLEEAQADRLAKGDENATDENYRPVTDDDNDMIDQSEYNTRVKKD